MDCQIVPKVHCQNLQLGNYSFQIMQLEYALIATISEVMLSEGSWRNEYRDRKASLY